MERDLEFSSFHPALSWRSVVAGTLISIFMFAILLSLGIAIGGVSLSDGASLRGSGTWGGIWLLLSVIISVFTAGYFTSRISNFESARVGVHQGLVVAALFVGFVLWQIAGMAGWLTQSAGNFLGGAAQIAGPVASSSANFLGPVVNDVVEDNLAGVQLRGEPQTIATGIASRMLRGDTEAAKSYLARNSNLTVPEVDQRINQLSTQMSQMTENARMAAAQALQVSGWSLFALLIFALIGGVGGGLLGARSNLTSPSREPEFSRRTRPAYT